MILRKMMVAAAIVATTATAAVFANESKITQGFKSYDAMGCMLLRECKEDVDEVFSLLDISNEYPNTEAFTSYSTEFNMMLMTLNQIGVNVYLADSKYFPINHRGVYHTVTNNFYLNRDHMGDPGTLMMLMRHEGWHAAQDCMAGTIDNSLIAIIHNEDDVPMIWQEIASDTYKNQPSAIPWEKEAFWAGKTEGMTMNALQACARGSMWLDYTPTPKTAEWLIENGWMED